MCVRVCACVLAPCVCVCVLPGSGHTHCRRCERFRCAWLLFSSLRSYPCPAHLRLRLRLRLCRTLSPFAVAVAISPLFGSNLDTFVMVAAAAVAAETEAAAAAAATTCPCHRQLAACQTFYNRISQLNRTGRLPALGCGRQHACTVPVNQPQIGRECERGGRERGLGSAIIVWVTQFKMKISN